MKGEEWKGEEHKKIIIMRSWNLRAKNNTLKFQIENTIPEADPGTCSGSNI